MSPFSAIDVLSKAFLMVVALLMAKSFAVDKFASEETKQKTAALIILDMLAAEQANAALGKVSQSQEKTFDISPVQASDVFFLGEGQFVSNRPDKN